MPPRKPATPTDEQQERSFARAFEILFGDSTARHAYEQLARRDPLAGAVSRRRSVRLWRAWQAARIELENGRPLEAFRALQASMRRDPPDFNAEDLVEAERLTLAAQCLAEGNQPAPALDTGSSALRVLRRFVARLETDRDACRDELYEMLEVLTAVNMGDANRTETIIGAWAATRGVDIFTHLAKLIAPLTRRSADADVRRLEQELVHDVEHLLRAARITLDERALTSVDFALGDIYTETAPEIGFAHFDGVARRLGVENDVGVQAAVNAANCLLGAGRFAEAELRYASLESLFEMRGDRAGAARVWMSECLARWKRLKDPEVRHSLIGAIKMFEESLPRGMDVMTRYTQKRFIEPGYLLLITANAYSTDRSDERIDETLSAAWAVLSRDLLANLEPEQDADSWGAVLARERGPLAAMKTALAPFPSLGVVHLISGIDCLVWIVYGFNEKGEFRYACVARRGDHAAHVTELIRVMYEHLPADTNADALAVHGWQRELEQVGEAIAADLPDDFRAVLSAMHRVVYLPHPFGDVDEFPLAALRMDGQWLGERIPITRSPSVSHLREMLSPNRAPVTPSRVGVVVVGDPRLADETLKATQYACERALRILNALGFEAAVQEQAGTAEMGKWLDGGAGALHYIGHGVANEVFEALPLASGEFFGPLDADRLKGMRVPFLFICACVAARIRAGAGGYQTGIASKLVERGAPAAVAFTMPVVEERAYALAETFYRAARTLPFGEAARAAMRATEVPAYVRLAMTAYGDPSFVLGGIAGAEPVATLSSEAARWESRLRSHCVLRTAASEAALRFNLADAPAPLADSIRTWLDDAFREPVASTAEQLDTLETLALTAPGMSDAARLSVRAAVCAEHLHASGIERVPIVIDTEPTSIRRLLECARFLAVLGGALFDPQLNGLGNSLVGRVITIDQNDARPGAVFLRQGREKLLAFEERSLFVRALRMVDAKLLEHYGLAI